MATTDVYAKGLNTDCHHMDRDAEQDRVGATSGSPRIRPAPDHEPRLHLTSPKTAASCRGRCHPRFFTGDPVKSPHRPGSLGERNDEIWICPLARRCPSRGATTHAHAHTESDASRPSLIASGRPMCDATADQRWQHHGQASHAGPHGTVPYTELPASRVAPKPPADKDKSPLIVNKAVR